MEPILGWTALSREALRKAEAQLREEAQGVRDEIGFLALHQGYANRLFPGTSVLHTRLRYVLFVPWLYEHVSRKSNGRRFEPLLRDEEVKIAGRLKGEDGVIGGRSYPRPTTVPPSMVYWSAMGVWGILRNSWDGTIPFRSTVHRQLSRPSSRFDMKDDDGVPLNDDQRIFVQLPQPPNDFFDASVPLDFQLRPEEHNFLRRLLIAVEKPETKAPSLLALLADREKMRLKQIPAPWDPAVLNVADADDRPALIRAGQAAALSAIGRAVYAHLVESIRADNDGLSTEDRHRSYLREVMSAYRSDALDLDIPAMLFDVPGIPGTFREVLEQTQLWVKKGSMNTAELQFLYEKAETRRKGQRARLSKTLAGRNRRAEWDPQEQTLAEPLHYRWFQVRRLLTDLWGEK